MIELKLIRNKWLPIAIVGLVVTTAWAVLAPSRNTYSNDNDIFSEFNNVYTFLQPRSFILFTSSPTLRDLKEQEIGLVRTNRLKLVVRSSNTLHYFSED